MEIKNALEQVVAEVLPKKFDEVPINTVVFTHTVFDMTFVDVPKAVIKHFMNNPELGDDVGVPFSFMFDPYEKQGFQVTLTGENFDDVAYANMASAIAKEFYLILVRHHQGVGTEHFDKIKSKLLKWRTEAIEAFKPGYKF